MFACPGPTKRILLLIGVLVPSISGPLYSTAQTRSVLPAVQNAQAPAEGVRFDSGQSAQKIPFELSSNIILLQVQVNNSRPLWFIFDTGANASVINASLVKELKLQAGPRVRGNASGGKIDAALIPGVSLTVSGVTVFNQTLASLPLDIFAPVLGKPIAGIIGYDFIQQFVVEADYAARLINLYSPANFSRPANGAILPIKFMNRKPFVSARIKLEDREAVEGEFMIDTGADGVMSVNAPFTKTHEFLKSLSITRQSISGGAGGTSNSITARAQNVQLGRFIIDKPLVEFSQAAEGTDTLTTYAGLLGGEVFRRFTLILDYSRQQIVLVPNAHLSEAVEADMSGLDLMADGEDFKTVVINEVAANSPAEAAGIKGEDELVTVDGRPVSEIGLDQIRQLFRKDGKEYSMSIKRGEEILPIKIKLKRLM